jgi:hypothetical protein
MDISANNKDTPKSLDLKALSLLEKANEFQWTVQILSVALFIDSTLCVLTGKNILTYPWEQFQWPRMLGSIIVAALAYSVLASLLLPLAEACVGQIIRIIYYHYLSSFFFDSDSYKRSKNQVYYWELQEHADENQSGYALARYKEWEASAKKSNEEIFTLGRISFRALALLLANIYYSTSEHPSTIFTLAGHLNFDAFIVSIVSAVLILFGLGCRAWCRPGYPTNWVSYAPLYNQIEEKRRIELERQRELAEQLTIRGRMARYD